MSETTLYITISNDPGFTIPPINESDMVITSMDSMRSALYNVADDLIAGGAGTAVGTRLLVNGVGTVPFTALDIIASWNAEGGLQATVTAVGASVTGIGTSMVIGGLVGGIPGAILGGVFGGFATLLAGKVYDGAWDYGENVINKIIYDSNNQSLSIITNNNNFDDIKTIMDPIISRNSNISISISTPTDMYAVQTGDSLYRILSKYGQAQTEANLDKLIQANPYLTQQNRVSADKKFVLLKKQETITIPKEFIKPVDYSRLVEHAQAVANGTASSVVDLQVPPDFSLPLPAAGGQIPQNLGGGNISPTLPTSIYQYTAMPSAGGFWGGVCNLKIAA